MWFADLGIIGYDPAWELQRQAHEKVERGGEEGVFLLEHKPVITFGRRGETQTVLVSREELARRGVEVVESDRGGDVTFHGPGQLVVYPIIRLKDHGLLVGGYVKKLENIVVACLKEFGIEGFLDPGAIGVWVKEPEGRAAKICALGVRVKGGISMHGIALNLSTDLDYFGLINPCGIGRPATTMRRILGEKAPEMEELKERMKREMAKAFEG